MPPAHGKFGAVYVSPNGTGVAVPILQLSKWSLNRDTENVKTTSFGDLNHTYVQGLPDLKGALSGFWNSATDPLYAAGVSADGVKMYLYPDRQNTPTAYDYGPAWLNTSIDVDVNGAITLSGTFVANGSWGHKP